ncbi:MAG TPA: agglutinin biogenesis protein MshP [Burkholderiales bacterium]|jgi:MSHA biogenesis protein MshP|nr:agglutinin biogenesis protein MshP [Burkholderiales bacterium]
MIAPRQRGFLVISAVFLVVVLAALVGYLMTVSTTSQAASAADQSSARAYQAARTGAEWALYLVSASGPSGGGTLKTDCGAGSTTKTLSPGGVLAAFTVTVSCTSAAYTEGGNTVRRYSITSNACNDPNAGICPNNTATSTTYIDREVAVSVTDQ